MKRKTYVLLFVMVAAICAASYMFSQIQHVYASKEDKVLSGVNIVLDPGHGGKDDGARSEGVKEQEINLAISLKLKTALETQGASVTLTRDGAYDLASDGAANRKREDMKKRVGIINEEPNDMFISVHLNSYPNAAIHGAQAFYKKDDQASKALADVIQKHFNALTKEDKVSKAGDYYILNNSERPGVLVECGFISNQAERTKLIDSSYQEQLADSLCQSILEYLDVLSL